MKNLNKINAYLIAIITLAITGLAGCSTTGMQRSEKTTTTMQTMENDINSAASQLDATNASLNDLLKPGQTDVKKAFDLYSKNVDKLESMQKSFAKHADEMQAKGKDYFDEWKKEGDAYKNPQIQKLSEDRRLELGKVYDRIALNSVGVKEAFSSYVSDNKEIQTYLSNDLTSKGTASIGPVSQKVTTDGSNLKDAIKNVQTAIDQAKSEMVKGGN